MKNNNVALFIFKWLARLLVYAGCAFSLYSLVWITLSSLKTNNEFFSNIWGLFKVPQFGNYLKVLKDYSLGLNFANSLFVVIIATVGILAVSAPAAYVLARINFPFRGAMANFFTFGMGVPYQLLLIPLFFLLYGLRLVDSRGGLILVYIALSLPFTIFLLVGFFKSLPREMEEAAYIDGCGPMRAFWEIMLPLCQGGIITAGIFNFISLWNEFLLAFTFLTDESKYTLSIGLYGLEGSMQYTGDWVCLFAGFAIVIIPTLVVYILLSKQIIEGLTIGAVKG
jgi:ABC-type glycerol-3-phosphate transport system permease component